MKLFSSLASLSTVTVAFCFFSYAFLYVAGYADKPLKDSSTSSSMIIVGSLIICLLPISLLWLSKNFDLIKMKDGYSKQSELVFDCILIVCNFGFLCMFIEQVLPSIG